MAGFHIFLTVHMSFKGCKYFCDESFWLTFLFQEREEAVSLFRSKRGKEIQREIAKKAKTFVPGAGLPEPKKATGKLFRFLFAVGWRTPNLV